MWREFWISLSSPFVSASVVSDTVPAVVSLTSHSQRIRRVHLTIESIGRGELVPQRLILWVDSDADYDRALRSRPLRRLMKRGLEIERSEPMGPHSKYYPYVASQELHSTPLVTADDDVLYPRDWLQRLVAAYKADPAVISCFRAHRMIINGGLIAPYSTWPSAEGRRPSFSTFLTGVSGVIYPPEFLDHLRRMGEGFRGVALRADDVWINAQAVSAGFRSAILAERSVSFPVVVGTQRVALWRHNTAVQETGFRSENDQQIAAAYSAEAVRRVAAEVDSA